MTADTSGIADRDGLDNVSYSYQWIRNAGTTDSDIQDATASTYTLIAADEGKTIKVRVSFTDDGGNTESLTSTATDTVASAAPTQRPLAPQSLTGTANTDGTITLHWTAPDNSSITGYQILRRKPREGENTLLVYVSNTNSTATTYTDPDAPSGTLYVYRVKAINSLGAGAQSNYVNVDH